MVKELDGSVLKCVHDQNGNHVIQKCIERLPQDCIQFIISSFYGKVLALSTHLWMPSDPEERQVLVNEMLGYTDENEPLQAMMKDPFENYVVQKVLETCDDQSLALIISRIKVHLNALKRYTYGKHIVARVEKLITTGAM
ncbi:hypothetical protein Bca52824_096581 [Brassica carinata]|uniref:PUM-HD domain-containing protein n=1 Tax=Brassica carinata TaxID=52824 RepID=A0A8X7P150_BRACI|nr:hypothetical protein Bca52824_096581 [Brassica carinata]